MSKKWWAYYLLVLTVVCSYGLADVWLVAVGAVSSSWTTAYSSYIELAQIALLAIWSFASSVKLAPRLSWGLTGIVLVLLIFSYPQINERRTEQIPWDERVWSSLSGDPIGGALVFAAPLVCAVFAILLGVKFFAGPASLIRKNGEASAEASQYIRLTMADLFSSVAAIGTLLGIVVAVSRYELWGVEWSRRVLAACIAPDGGAFANWDAGIGFAILAVGTLVLALAHRISIRTSGIFLAFVILMVAAETMVDMALLRWLSMPTPWSFKKGFASELVTNGVFIGALLPALITARIGGYRLWVTVPRRHSEGAT
jgi:hypothetical protein